MVAFRSIADSFNKSKLKFSGVTSSVRSQTGGRDLWMWSHMRGRWLANFGTSYATVLNTRSRKIGIRMYFMDLLLKRLKHLNT
jgi:hypothetical protein